MDIEKELEDLRLSNMFLKHRVDELEDFLQECEESLFRKNLEVLELKHECEELREALIDSDERFASLWEQLTDQMKRDRV